MWNDPNQTPPPTPDLLPPELEDIASLVSADAVEWRRRVPPAGPLAQHLHQTLLPVHQQSGEIIGTAEDRMSNPVVSAAQSTTRDASGGTPPKPPARTLPVPLAAVAAVLIVALLVGVFATLGQSRARLGGDTATTTASPDVTSTPPTAAPTQISLKLPLTAGTPVTQQPGVPVVAPSDPRVIYEYADNGAGVVVRDSQNGGATWGEFLLPNFSGSIGAIELAVSPVDARNLFLRLTLGYFPGETSPCSPQLSGASAALVGSKPAKMSSALSRSGGGLDCTNAYASPDGGATWSLVRLPVPGSLFQDGVTFTYDTTIFQAQGTTLYGRVWQLDSSGSRTGDVRIVSTDDGGITWSDADAGLQSQVGHICAFSASPYALFAVVSTVNCWQWNNGTRSVWRSDDHGGQWTRTGDVPTLEAQPAGAFAAAATGGSAPSSVLFAWPEGAGVTNVGQIQASADGGQTWVSAPSAGLPAGVTPLTASATPLADGSLVVAFSASKTFPGQNGGSYSPLSVFAWSPNTSTWRRVTPDITLNGATAANVANLYVSTSLPLTVTLSLDDDFFSSSPTYSILPFA